ncbi:hypothetical protein [Absidia glauca]|uniref:C2H2-type domain-containing protein n=1 Tax=Absidia glauca TaxID=4829 RepID=A0A163JXL5_ABSGL|nr:hypothetical protein [Absidia glauca]
MECSDPYLYYLLDNINVSSFTELHEQGFSNPAFELRPTDFYSGLLSPNSQFATSPSHQQPPHQQQHHQTVITCFPSPTNTVIEAEKPSPLLQPHTVRSHAIDQYHQYQHQHPPCLPSSISTDRKGNHHRQQSILTTIESSKKKSIGKKQKRINELPYAPNLVNLQLTPPPKHTPSHSPNTGKKKTGPKSKSETTATILSSSPSSSTPAKSNNNYRCDYPNCDKTFTRPYNLKSHRRTHTAERPFECPLCSKSFARQHDRNRHAKLHLGIKPYACQFCNKSFARQDALNRHQRTDSSPIPTCSRSIGSRKKRKASVSSSSFSSSASSLPSPTLLFSSCSP